MLWENAVGEKTHESVSCHLETVEVLVQGGKAGSDPQSDGGGEANRQVIEWRRTVNVHMHTAR